MTQAPTSWPLRARSRPATARRRSSRSSRRPPPRSRSTITAFVVTASVALLALVGCQERELQGQFEVSRVASPLPALPSVRLLPDDLPRGRKGLTYGVTPYLGVATTREAFEPVARWLSTQLGVPVRFVLTKSYDDLVERVLRGEIDVMQLSPLSYIVAKERLPGLALLGASTSFGSADYSSLIVVRAGSKLRRLDDMISASIRAERERRRRRGDDRAVPISAGKRVRFGYVHQRSASGYLLPFQALLNHGIDPTRDLTMVKLGSHEAAIEALIAGKVDATAVSSGTLNNVRRGMIIGVGNLRILYKAGRIPYDALCAAPQVPESGRRKVAAAFGRLSTRTEEGRKVLGAARGVTGWAHIDDDRYAFLRKLYHQVRAEEWKELARRHRHAPSPATPTGAR